MNLEKMRRSRQVEEREMDRDLRQLAVEVLMGVNAST
jgi:hypothetical protein